MLQLIREKAQGWIAWAIVILITIPFALWGIQEYIGTGSDSIVAKVNGVEITDQALTDETRQTRENLRANLGDAYRADLFTEQMLRAQTLDRMINEQLLRSAVIDWGMRASNEMVIDSISTERAFQGGGGFDHELYRTVLRNNGLSEAGYEASVRQSLTLQQLQEGVAGSAFVTNHQLEQLQKLRGQRRTIAYAVIAADSLLSTDQPEDSAIEAYYKSHQPSYQLPERVKLDYLVLDVAGLAQQITADEASVKAWYAQHKDEFVAPEERRIRHILIPVEDGDDATALAKAEALHAQLAAGGDFAALAKSDSADPVSAAQGGDLGWVSHGMMVEPFENAAFALAKGALSEPVKSDFGYHLIEVTDIRGGGQSDYEEMADKITAAYRKSEAERVFYERSERLAELSYENPDNLEHAAQTLGLTVQHSDWIDRQGGEGDLASPKVLSAAFSDDVLNQGHNSELLELAPERLLVLRVVDHQLARPLDLAEVRDQVVRSVQQEQAVQAARMAGEAALAEIKAGTALADIAAASGWQFHVATPIDRDQADVPAAVRQHAFAMPRLSAAAIESDGVVLANGDYALLQLSAVEDGKMADLDEASRKMLAERVASLTGRMTLIQLEQVLRDRADVDIMLKASADSTR